MSSQFQSCLTCELKKQTNRSFRFETFKTKKSFLELLKKAAEKIQEQEKEKKGREREGGREGERETRALEG